LRKPISWARRYTFSFIGYERNGDLLLLTCFTFRCLPCKKVQYVSILRGVLPYVFISSSHISPREGKSAICEEPLPCCYDSPLHAQTVLFSYFSVRYVRSPFLPSSFFGEISEYQAFPSFAPKVSQTPQFYKRNVPLCCFSSFNFYLFLHNGGG